MQRRAFHPSLDFVVVRTFLHGEFQYEPGDPFPKEREISDEGQPTGGFVRAGQAARDHIPERMFRQLWEQYRIDTVDPVAAEADAEPENPAVEAVSPPAGADVAETPAEPVSGAETTPADAGADTLTGDAGDDTIVGGEGGDGVPSNEAPVAPTPENILPTVDEPKPFARPYQSNHKGFGKYDVTDATGALVADNVTKAAAEELMAGNA